MRSEGLESSPPLQGPPHLEGEALSPLTPHPAAWVVYREPELLLPNPRPTSPVFRLYFLQESRPLADTAGFNKGPF